MNVISTHGKKDTFLTYNEPIGLIIARNLQYLAKRSGLTEAEIARKIDCPPQTLNRMFRGQTPDPKISVVRKLSSFFEIPISNLLSENLSLGYENYKMLPLLEWEELSELNNREELLKNNTRRNWQPISVEISNSAFLLKSKKSMAPRIPHVTIFVVEPNIQPIDGDIIIVHFRENNIFSARELIIDAPQWILQNISGEDKSVYQSSEHNIIGIVIEKRFFQSR